MNNTPATKKLAGALLDYLHRSGKSTLPVNFLRELESALAPKQATVKAELTTALPLGKAELALVKAFVKQKLGNLDKLSTRLDPTLLAGFRLKLGDELIDASLASKLDLLHTTLR